MSRCSPINSLDRKEGYRLLVQYLNSRPFTSSSSLTITVSSPWPLTAFQFETHRLDDHLDKSTLVDIERHHKDVQYFVPTGVGLTLVSFGIDRESITEMGCWESTLIRPLSSSLHDHHETKEGSSPKIEVQIPSGTFTHEPPTLTHDSQDPVSPTSTVFSETTTLNETMSIDVTCCPAQHNSGRTLLSKNSSLWGSWYLTCRFGGEILRVYFAG